MFLKDVCTPITLHLFRSTAKNVKSEAAVERDIINEAAVPKQRHPNGFNPFLTGLLLIELPPANEEGARAHESNFSSSAASAESGRDVCVLRA